MKTFITKRQLAYVLGIGVEDARAVMCCAYAKEKGVKNQAKYNHEGKVIDDYPEAMEIAMIERNSNYPLLSQAVNDIYENYLKRPASRKYILSDYPQKEIVKIMDGKKKKIAFPSALKAILPDATINEIMEYWRLKYPLYV